MKAYGPWWVELEPGVSLLEQSGLPVPGDRTISAVSKTQLGRISSDVLLWYGDKREGPGGGKYWHMETGHAGPNNLQSKDGQFPNPSCKYR